MLINVVVMLVIIQFIIGLLFAFNVINARNEFLLQIYNSINSLLEPVLAPIRRILPRTGAIDFSPLVLIIALQILMRVLLYAAYGQ
ncbi:YggT family protein [Pelagerythrobacter marinus]|uniref:YggT family protein n=1 Tax=Pelagerythrobacter marinus TaxID=538382 RepID=A0ABW9V0F1_9SPHN|nr:YggT family protein [Pelagerythrobacter marinus]MEC9068115.1 YggT family protein [Pseudomonadota bacterium]MXO69923.1 YggT family protein [Pelagerythrobacter marinus]USA41160.1 YggT family protein [Pelagerythrobacter marinus]WPZ08518.1 YggT family protein [Pelagerythrobacter marinus]